VMTEQIRTVSKDRVLKTLEVADKSTVNESLDRLCEMFAP